MAFVNEKEKRRTIDYERNAYLVHTITNRKEGKNFAIFELHWNNEIISIHAIDNTTIENQERYVEWNVNRIFCIKDFMKHRNEIMEIIKQALETYGYSYSHDKIQKLKVHFNDKLVWQTISEN